MSLQPPVGATTNRNAKPPSAQSHMAPTKHHCVVASGEQLVALHALPDRVEQLRLWCMPPGQLFQHGWLHFGSLQHYRDPSKHVEAPTNIQPVERAHEQDLALRHAVLFCEEVPQFILAASAAAVMLVLQYNVTLGDQVHGKAPLTPFRIPEPWPVLNEGLELHARVRIHGSWQAQPLGTGVSAMQARLDPTHCMHTYTQMSHIYIYICTYIYIHTHVCM